MLRFFPNAKPSLDSLLDLITDLVADGVVFCRLVSLTHDPKRGGPVATKAAGLLRAEAGPTEAIARLRPFLSHPLVSPMQLESGLGHRQTRDGD
jgi:hypothetical protein